MYTCMCICIGISKTQSGRYLILGVESKETTEQHLIDLTIPYMPYTNTSTDRKLICISPRLFGHRYDCEHYIPKTSKKEGVKEVAGIYTGILYFYLMTRIHMYLYYICIHYVVLIRICGVYFIHILYYICVVCDMYVI